MPIHREYIRITGNTFTEQYLLQFFFACVTSCILEIGKCWSPGSCDTGNKCIAEKISLCRKTIIFTLIAFYHSGKTIVRKLTVIFMLLQICASQAAFQSAVITLVFPPGARSTGMGEVGTALADHEDVLYWNPAGLGIPNRRYRRGAFTEFHEWLLPPLKLYDLWHHYYAANYQPANPVFGGFGLNVNSINFGENTLTDEDGIEIAQFRSNETVYSLGWGFNFRELGVDAHAWGVALNLVDSRLAPGIGPGREGIWNTFAVDIGYLWQFHPAFRFGFTTMNMGPPILYGDRDQADPIPFTMNWALAFTDSIVPDNKLLWIFAAEFRMDREFAKNYIDRDPDPFYEAIFTDWGDATFGENMQEIQYHLGGEAILLNTFIGRLGFLLDWIGERYELTWGIGLKLFNHMQFDFSVIHSPEGYFSKFNRDIFNVSRNDSHAEGSYGIRHMQPRFSFSFFSAGLWSMSDRIWWMKDSSIRE